MDPNVVSRAAELFNRKLYFECHDLLEDAWAGTRGGERPFLRGLIQISVGMYHIAAGNYRGAVSQLEQGLEALEPFGARHAGLQLGPLKTAARRCLEKAHRAVAGESVSWEREDLPRMEWVEKAGEP